ncbi:uncharacterized protein LOC103523915 [Trichonephila clavata]|uniref:Uncharacterized protein LOC103523915 n=1 Tax=Trichonephila clavata TaxID=2740835 RepID=A0A8X6LRC6_TRICU|nr:uncharacterized protein LOC103523915 [Trichonephila clavata]
MIERDTGAGTGLYCNHFAFYKAVGRDTTNFDDEVEAIFIALNQLSARKRYFPRAIILADSKIENFSNNKVCTSERIYESRKILNTLMDSVVLQWIPAHCVFEGNERAGFLAGPLFRLGTLGTCLGSRKLEDERKKKI